MQRTSISLVAPMMLALILIACGKNADKASTPAPTEPVKESPVAAENKETQAAPAPPAPTANPTTPKPSIDTKTEVATDKAQGEGLADAEKQKLASVYQEIYCAQRRGESEKLLEIYTKNGFDNPETWTKVWTKAAQDGAWVAKTTHDAIRACGDESPPTSDQNAP